MIKIIESPREGMQGIGPLIPTDTKVSYINAILKCGFDTVEVGSIVSSKIIPQMGDSLEVISRLDLDSTTSKPMVLVVNKRGGEIASGLDQVKVISYPFSFSPTFLRHNVNATVEDSLKATGEILNLCDKSGKEFVCYISMAFGNPYDDPWSLDMLCQWVETLKNMGVKTIPLSNVAIEIDAPVIGETFMVLLRAFPGIEFGLHLHTDNHGLSRKLEAAYKNGCRRFDAVIGGLGGCPMAGKEMLGNLDTGNLVHWLDSNGIDPGIDLNRFLEAQVKAGEVYHT
jgi:hydroxymethylglutaryl-CoA lyase